VHEEKVLDQYQIIDCSSPLKDKSYGSWGK